MYIHNLFVDDGCPLAGARAWPLATLTQYGYGMVVRRIIKHPTQHSLLPPTHIFKVSDTKCQLPLAPCSYPKQKLQISNNCPGANDVRLFPIFSQDYRAKI